MGFLTIATQNIKALHFMVSEIFVFVLPFITLWELSVAMETSFDPTLPKIVCSQSYIPMMLQIKISCDQSTCFGDIHV